MSFKSFLKKARGKRIAIVLHSLADADSVGSAYALKRLVPNAIIVAPDHVTASAKRLLDELGERVSNCVLPGFDALVLVDQHSKRFFPGILETGIPVLAVFDHHSMHSDAVKAEQNFIDEEASSAAEVVYEQMKKNKMRIDAKSALALLAGIVADSAGFKNSNEETFVCTAELIRKSKRSYHYVQDLVEVPLDFSQRLALLMSLRNVGAEKMGNFLIAYCKASAFQATMAAKLVELGADVALVAVEMHNSSQISCRIRHGFEKKINAGHLMKKVGDEFGASGGGHAGAAGINGLRKEDCEKSLFYAVRIARETLAGV